jgi:hypothetical protein
MKAKNIQNNSLGKLFQFLSVSILVVAVLAGINLHLANASAQSEEPNAPTAFCDDVTEIPKTECEALEALYYSTGGPGWINQSGWLSTLTPCSWFRITCEDGHVSMINLYSNNLVGQIPAELENLTYLTYLGLNQNYLSGEIPHEFGNLTNLERIFLYYNQLSGSIPIELGNLPNLTHLSVFNNNLSGEIPIELGNLTELQSLQLSNNQLTGEIPPELGNLSSLRLLYLHHNQITGSIPPELGNLSNLESLYLEQNLLSGEIPPEIGNLTNLYSLWIYGNAIEGEIPATVGNLTRLTSLYISQNALRGEIPGTIMNLVNLGSTYTQFGYNSLFSTNSEVVAFLDTKSPGWADTQTVVPNNFQGSSIGNTEVELTWDPILYTAGIGYYEVSFALNEAGPFSVAGITPDKTTGIMNVDDLDPGETYYFRVRTFSAADWLDPAELWSDFSPTISLTMPLALGEITPETGGELTFDPAGGGTVTIQVPSGAVDETIILQATSNPAITVPPGSALVGVSFNLTAILDGLPLDSYDFLAPVTIRIDYTDEQVASLDEDSLRLYFWDDATETWLDAAETCDPISTYTRNPDDNWFSVDICHLTQFAVFGEIEAEDYSVFMPTLNK